MRSDAIVIGGGPAGAIAALLLARAGWSVAVIEKMEYPRRKVCGEFLSATNLPLLRELGLAEHFLDLAGPAVRSVGVFAGDQAVIGDMPPLDNDRHSWGHAVGRERLDALLLDRAVRCGARLWQPYSAVDVRREAGTFVCSIAATNTKQTFQLQGRVLIAAHGSWEAGPLTTQPPRAAARPSDLFGFKGRFLDSRLQPGLMPLLAFPGGYGGMVHTDRNRVSLSCCIRRDYLERCRREQPGKSAADAVLAHITRKCAGVRDALDGAALEPNSWRSAGPIQPGIRATHRAGMFLIGNAAGEAHPVVAEGISMAMQSAWLLAQHLISPTIASLEHAAAEYDRDWRRAFSWRIRAAAGIAHWAMRPAPVALTLPLLRVFPLILTESARATGKVSALCSPSC